MAIKHYKLNEKQKKALTSLSRAFDKCKKASLCFQGMDGSLLVFDADEYNRLTASKSICEQQYADEGNQGEMVETHKTYRDSGGW